MQKKIILFDSPVFGVKESYSISDEATCGKCEVSYDTTLRLEAAAVVFHFTGIQKKGVAPRRLAYAMHCCDFKLENVVFLADVQ